MQTSAGNPWAAAGIAAVLLFGCEEPPPAPAGAPPASEAFAQPVPRVPAEPATPAGDEPLPLEWDALVPEGWRPDELLGEYDLDSIEDGSPEAQALMAKLDELWKASPVVESLDGRLVRIPGFVVPLEGDGERVSEFLLVPYYGACIHVPPPPSNQTVHVKVGAPGAKVEGMFAVVWVTGRLRVEHTGSELAEAGYAIEASAVEPYEDAPVERVN